ncbi:cytochrome P450 [Favolaschia claudopus]|uniref:Cytochrome P450 n=1 Tax=Favolaschia claudopus TaxID=2862362 RepID=A0AAW0D252_9AGAR
MTLSIYLFPFFSLLLLWVWYRRRNDSRHSPPGPPKDPLIGHLRHMPAAQAPFVFHDWAKIYGDVMQLKVLGKSIIVLDSLQAAVGLLDKRGAIYSDRPPLPLYELLGWNYMLSFMRYGETFTRHRQVYQAFFSRQQCAEFEPIQTEEAHRLVRNILSSETDDYGSVLSRYTTGILVQVVAGHKITSDDDHYLELSKMVYQVFSVTGAPGGTPIDFIPALRHLPGWFPGAYYAGVARAWQPVVRQLYDYPYESVQQEKEAGNASPSFLLSRLQEIENNTTQLTPEEIKGAAATLFGAELPTRSAIAVFLLAMVLYPECQIIAHKEIDSVVGASRLPTFSDRGDLPYIECILQETLRWNPVAPLGVPHRSTQDDVYRGMFIPKGSIIFANIRGMALDENTYKDPTKFIPERFIPSPAGPGEPEFGSLFGFGRRRCPALHFVERNLWIAIVSILATCTVSNAVDEKGNIIVPEATMSDGVDSYPKDLRCLIKPRSRSAEGLIAETALVD